MKMKILLPFWLFFTTVAQLTNRCSWKDNRMKTISFGWQEMKYNGCVRCYDGGKCTTSDINITRDEAMTAHELNEICTFLPLTTFKILSFSQLKISREYSLRRHQFLPSSMRRAANRMSWNVESSGNFIANVIFIIEIIITPNAME